MAKTYTIDIFNLKGLKTPSKSKILVDLDKEKFAYLLSQVIRVYLFNQKQFTASTKTRGQVTGSTRKIYRQKGTGRARHGNIKAPIFVGGGVVFGPLPLKKRLTIPKKMSQKAFKLSIFDKIENNKLIIVKGLSEIPLKTKIFVNLLKKVLPKNYGKEKFLVLTSGEKNLIKAVSNITNVVSGLVNTVNTYDILSSSSVVIDEKTFDLLLKRLGIKTKALPKKTVMKTVKKGIK